MSQKDGMFYGQLVKHEGKLQYVESGHSAKYKAFVASLEEGQVVDHFMDANVDTGTLPQLAKIHKCIRELAKDIGYSFEDMKLEVKKKAGLCIKKEIGGEMYMVCKSFSKCSKDELGLAIQTIIDFGDMTGINFR
jgi:hypothetical protein